MFRVSKPKLVSCPLAAQEELDFNGEEEEICSALLLRLIYSRGYTILRSLSVLLALSSYSFVRQ